MPIGDQVGRGDDDVVRRLGALESAYQVILGIAGSAKALAAAIQTGLGNLASSGTTWAGPVSSPSFVNGSTGAFSSSLSSVGAYNTDVSLLAGARQTVWQHNSGIYGFAPSSEKTKANLKAVPFTAADVRAVSPFMFQYKAQLAIRDDPTNEQYDPDYVVPWEIGLMAEHLIAHKMSCFVFWDEDGVTPRGINYDLFGAIAPLVVLADQEARLVAAGL